MKKLFSFVFAALFFSALCFAEEGQVSGFAPDEHEPMVKEIKSQTVKLGTTVVESMTFKGTLEIISKPDIDQGSRYKIIAVDNSGNKTDFFLVPGLSITEYSGNIIPMKDLHPGDKIVLEYTISKSGAKKALSIIRQ